MSYQESPIKADSNLTTTADGNPINTNDRVVISHSTDILKGLAGTVTGMVGKNHIVKLDNGTTNLYPTSSLSVIPKEHTEVRKHPFFSDNVNRE